MNTPFIQSAAELVNNVPPSTDMMTQLAHKLSEAIYILQNIQDQVNAQFKAGDTHATFSRQTLEALKFDVTVKTRKFRHKRGFSDGTDYVSICPNEIVQRNGLRREQTGFSLENCLHYVKQGTWIEIP
jgi:hypothetical protein